MKLCCKNAICRSMRPHRPQTSGRASPPLWHAQRPAAQSSISSRDRRAAQSILDYWANALYRANQPTPAARLADFDPLLAPELPDEPCPYQGLAAFGQDQQAYFFGRERLVQEMVQRLARGDRLLAVAGASGSGKSSVVLGGLLPALRRGAVTGSEAWRVITLTPGSQPLANLAAAVRVQLDGQPTLPVAQAAQLPVRTRGFCA